MSWSITIDDIDEIDTGDPRLEQMFRKLAEDNPVYELDALAAFDLAKNSGLVSATLSGGRTPSPYNGPDSVVICVVGFDSRKVGQAPAKPFYEQTRENILSGPDYPDDDTGGEKWLTS